MYHPSIDMAQMDRDKQNLAKRFLIESRFVEGLNLSRGHLYDSQILNKHFVKCHFQNISLLSSKFSNCNFDHVDFTDCELRTVTFKNCSFKKLQLENVLISEIIFEDCYFEDTNFNFESGAITLKDCHIYKPTVVATKVSAELSAKGEAPVSAATVAPLAESAPKGGRFGHLDREKN